MGECHCVSEYISFMCFHTELTVMLFFVCDEDCPRADMGKNDSVCDVLFCILMLSRKDIFIFKSAISKKNLQKKRKAHWN